MRAFLPVVLASLALVYVARGCLSATAAAAGGSPGKTPAPASAPLPATPKPAPAAASVDNDAPARHARRTACLKDAKARKLVGAQRASFVKNCTGA